MKADERVQMDNRFAQIAETRRPNSLEWLRDHHTRLERMRLEPEFAAYTVELLFAKVEDLTGVINRLLAIQSSNGRSGFGHVGPPPAGKPGRKN